MMTDAMSTAPDTNALIERLKQWQCCGEHWDADDGEDLTNEAAEALRTLTAENERLKSKIAEFIDGEARGSSQR